MNLTVTYTPSEIPNFDITDEWISDHDANTLASIVVGELDGDISSPEIVTIGPLHANTTAYGSNMIYVLDGATGQLKYRPNALPIASTNKELQLVMQIEMAILKFIIWSEVRQTILTIEESLVTNIAQLRPIRKVMELVDSY